MPGFWGRHGAAVATHFEPPPPPAANLVHSGNDGSCVIRGPMRGREDSTPSRSSNCSRMGRSEPMCGELGDLQPSVVQQRQDDLTWITDDQLDERRLLWVGLVFKIGFELYELGAPPDLRRADRRVHLFDIQLCDVAQHVKETSVV